MRTIFLLLLLLSASAHGQRNLTAHVFQANVRPVLNAILNDFHQMVVLFPSYPKDLVATIKTMDALNADKESLKAECPRTLNAKCLKTMDSLRRNLLDLQARTLELVSRVRPSHSLHINSQTGMRLIQEFQIALKAAKGNLDNMSFLVRAKIPDKKRTFTLIKELDALNTKLSLAVVEFIPQPYKEDFRHFFYNFVRPIELHVSKNQNYEFLNRNVNQLNFALNLFNMNLTKRNKKTPDGMAPYLSLMHNRWNRILRYYM